MQKFILLLLSRGLYNDSDLTERRLYTRHPERRRGEALTLHHEAHVPVGPPCCPEALETFATALLDYTIVVVDAGRCYERFVHGHGAELIGIRYADNHYDAALDTIQYNTIIYLHFLLK